jgi:CHRD domain-containing protein
MLKENPTMRKVAIITVALLALLLLSSTAASQVNRTAASNDARHFEADLTGAQEVPPVATQTEGDITVRFDRELTEAQFRLNVDDGKAVTMAHLHCAPAGVNGPVIAFLFGNVPGGFDVDGRLARFTLTDANITAITPHPDCMTTIGMDITSIADLAQAIRAGKIYANVHTVAHPGGEIRGQLVED